MGRSLVRDTTSNCFSWPSVKTKQNKKHVSTVHGEKKNFKCELCHTKFGERGTLKKHVTTIHEGKK